MTHNRRPALQTRVVHVVERLLSATVHVPTPAATRLLRRTATATGCEHDSDGRWIVHGTRVERVVSALEAAGYVVHRTDTSTPDATSARTS